MHRKKIIKANAMEAESFARTLSYLAESMQLGTPIEENIDRL